MLTLFVSLAAGLGAVTRYAVDVGVQRRLRSFFPVGTLVVNVTGSAVLGLLVGLALHHGMSSDWLAVTGAGFAGGYTTLSTWAWESLALAEQGELLRTALNVVGSLLLGIAAAAAGLGVALLP